MILTDLRAILEADLPFADLFDALIEDLCKGGFVKAGAVIPRATHRPALSAELQAAASNCAPRCLLSRSTRLRATSSLPIPFLTGLAFPDQCRRCIEINEELVMAAEHVKRATELIREFIRARGPATVSDLRQMLGSTRRVILPLLVRLDRDGVTMRQGENASCADEPLHWKVSSLWFFQRKRRCELSRITSSRLQRASEAPSIHRRSRRSRSPSWKRETP